MLHFKLIRLFVKNMKENNLSLISGEHGTQRADDDNSGKSTEWILFAHKKNWWEKMSFCWHCECCNTCLNRWKIFSLPFPVHIIFLYVCVITKISQKKLQDFLKRMQYYLYPIFFTTVDLFLHSRTIFYLPICDTIILYDIYLMLNLELLFQFVLHS